MLTLDGFSKALETLIKAPLWVFLALALATTVPLLPAPFVSALGLSRNLKIGNLPIAIFAILFWCFFASSAMANSYAKLSLAFRSHITRNRFQRKYLTLSAEARLLLFIIDENNLRQMIIPNGEGAVRELRDAGLLEYDGAHTMDGRIGLYVPTMTFLSDVIYHRQWIRTFLRERVGDTTAFEKRLQAAQHSY